MASNMAGGMSDPQLIQLDLADHVTSYRRVQLIS
jgi:hypothetical protein